MYNRYTVDESSFTRVIDSVSLKSAHLCYPEQNTAIRPLFSNSAGYSSEWLLSHHYSWKNRDLKYNRSPRTLWYELETCTLSYPFYEIIVDNKIVWESFHSQEAFTRYLFNPSSGKYYFLTSTKQSEVIREKKVFCLPTRWYDTNYYHWVIECLPRLFIFKDLKQIYPELKLALHQFDKGSFQCQWLEILGIKEDDCLILEKYVNYIFSSMIYVPILGANFVSGASISRLQYTIKGFLQTYKPTALCETPKNVYIARKTGMPRSIANEQELKSVLTKFDITKIYSEDFSVADQLYILANANYIVADHGSGISNIVGCMHSCSILEIMTPSGINPCFFDLAQALGLRYGYTIASYIPNFEKRQILYLKPIHLSDGLSMLFTDEHKELKKD